MMMIRTSSEDAAVMAIQILILYTPWLFVQGHFSVRVRDSNAMHPLGVVCARTEVAVSSVKTGFVDSFEFWLVAVWLGAKKFGQVVEGGF